MQLDVETQLTIDLHAVVRNVTEWAKDLLVDYIDRYVYQWGAQQKKMAAQQGQLTMYYIWNKFQPTGQFKRSIVFEQMHTDIENYIGYTIFSKQELMEYDGVDNLHGNRQHDYRAVLMERLNEGYTDMPNHAHIEWWKNRPQFFDMYLDELEDLVYQRFEYEMTKRGLAWRKEGVVNGEFI